MRGHYTERHAEKRCQEAGRGIPRSRKRGPGVGRVRGWRSRMVLGSGRGAERRDKGPKGHPKGRPKGQAKVQASGQPRGKKAGSWAERQAEGPRSKPRRLVEIPRCRQRAFEVC